MLIDQEIMELDLKAGWKKGFKKVIKETNNQVLTRAAVKADQESKIETVEKEPNKILQPKLVDIIDEYESDNEFELVDILITQKKSVTPTNVEEYYNLPVTNKC